MPPAGAAAGVAKPPNVLVATAGAATAPNRPVDAGAGAAAPKMPVAGAGEAAPNTEAVAGAGVACEVRLMGGMLENTVLCRVILLHCYGLTLRTAPNPGVLNKPVAGAGAGEPAKPPNSELPAAGAGVKNAMLMLLLCVSVL